MAKRMLIDASHAEETRVVVADGTRLEEFDFESAARKQLKGNVYLAKVMRVEPSLQAAFVDYGGNRHGFLPFNEIHPDYYQIPVADREALYAEQAEADETDEPALAQTAIPAENGAGDEAPPDGDEAPPDGDAQPDGAEASDSAEAADGAESAAAGRRRECRQRQRWRCPSRALQATDDSTRRRRQRRCRGHGRRRDGRPGTPPAPGQPLAAQPPLSHSGGDQKAPDPSGAGGQGGTRQQGRRAHHLPLARRALHRAHAQRDSGGGGISRKIVNADDRRRLKKIMNDLDIPARMAVIVRTAGLSRSKTEIRRDLEYLVRRWQNIRDLTMESMAPCVINEEANLIRRSIRDLYTRDIEQILIEGDEGYKTAKGFMKTMIPSHAARVKPYRDRIPLFVRYQIESQLDSMYGPELQLKSGGYLVINPTEALVAIDVNSGRATKERTIEETALRTNLEAAEEIARQLRLRDLAGLIVIDFIDMDENRNQRAVERKLKEAMRVDRARIRMGRISPFGLMELSRQRLRPSLVEASMERCHELRRHRGAALGGIVGGPRAPRHRGGRAAGAERRDPAARAGGGRALHPQPQAADAGGHRAALRVRRELRAGRQPRAAELRDRADRGADRACRGSGRGGRRSRLPRPSPRPRRRLRSRPRGAGAGGASRAARRRRQPRPAPPPRSRSRLRWTARRKTRRRTRPPQGTARPKRPPAPSAGAAAGGAAAAAPRSSRSSRTRRKRRARARPRAPQRRMQRRRRLPRPRLRETSRPRPRPRARPRRALRSPMPMARPNSADGAVQPEDGASEPAFRSRRTSCPARSLRRSWRSRRRPLPTTGRRRAASAAEPLPAEVAVPDAPASADQDDAAPAHGHEEADAEDTAPAAPAALPDDRPRRRGWWQRIASTPR